MVRSQSGTSAGRNQLSARHAEACERWTYQPPAGHTTAWVAVSRGTLDADGRASTGELATFDVSEAPIALQASADLGASFVLGSAVPHPYPLLTRTAGVPSPDSSRRIQWMANRHPEGDELWPR